MRNNPQSFMSSDSEGSMEVVGDVLFYSGDISNKFLVFLQSNTACKREKTLVINSLGGDALVAFAAVDWMEKIPASIVATGSCMSAAIPIIAAGKKGCRFATHRTRFMVHSVWHQYDRPLYPEYMRNELAEMDRIEMVHAELMARHTGKHDKEWWNNKCKSDPCVYLSAIEAKELGIIDEVLADEHFPHCGKILKKKRTTRKK